MPRPITAKRSIALESADKPIYKQIEAHLTSLIDAGEGRSSPLPTEPDLVARFGVSRMTVRQAYQGLVAAGLVVRNKRQGSFATGHVTEQLPIEGIPDFQGWIIEGEAATSRRVLELSLVKAPVDVARAFGIRAGTRVTYVALLRKRGNVSCLDTRYLPAEFFSSLGVELLERKSIIQAVAEAGCKVEAGNIEIDARRASKEEAKALGIGVSEPILERRVMFTDGSDRCFLIGASRYPGGEMYSFRIGFRAPKPARPNRRKTASPAK